MFLFGLPKRTVVLFGVLVVVVIFAAIFYIVWSGSLTVSYAPISEGILSHATTSGSVSQNNIVQQPQSAYAVHFTSPYPLKWTDQQFIFSLTGVSIGMVTATAMYPGNTNPASVFMKPNAGYYAVGDQFYGLTIFVKIDASASGGCVPFNMRRISPEGDLLAPASRQFFLPSGGCSAEPNTTYTDQRIVFEVPKTDTAFTLGVGNPLRTFFTVQVSGDTLHVEKLSAPPANITIPKTGGGSLNNQPLVVTWVSPSGPVQVKRGDAINLSWAATGGTFGQSVYASLSPVSSQASGSPPQNFIASSQSGAFRVTVPPGSYNLSLPGYGGSSGSGQKIVPVEVIGPPPAVSLLKSSVELTATDSSYAEIVADGVCSVNATVILADEYGYWLSGKAVDLKTDRGSLDTIVSTASATNQDGDIEFVIVSHTPGIAKLSASADGVVLSDTPVIKILNQASSTCPDNNSFGYGMGY